MSLLKRCAPALLALPLIAAPVRAQDLPNEDPVLRAIWQEGREHSQVYPLAQALLDSIGPRLTGSPQLAAANDWLVGLYRQWGIQAENEQYGTWKGWERGITHVDLVAPWVRTLDATMLAWSRGTAKPVEGDVIALPASADPAAVAAWKKQAKGKWVLASLPEPTCRPLGEWQGFADPDGYDAFVAARDTARSQWRARMEALGINERHIGAWLKDAGAAGAFASLWSEGYGARRIFGDTDGAMPVISLGCEDYGLLYRLAENGQRPRVRVDARSKDLGTVPVFNTVATIPGTEHPDQYVLLSAHLDSWDGGQGATDNGTGTIIMAEAMRLLKKAYPSPRRTIIVGHWASEEQGLNGSRAFAADHPDIVAGLQAAFNQDNGTGRITRVSMQGLTDAGPHFVRWITPLPRELRADLRIDFPGTPGGGGSDYAAFTCSGAPSFGLGSDSWDYFRYTWHTNLDTLDKLSFDHVRDNAILVAMLAYMAADDPDFIRRERRTLMPANPRTGETMTWPQCEQPMRSFQEYRW